MTLSNDEWQFHALHAFSEVAELLVILPRGVFPQNKPMTGSSTLSTSEVTDDASDA